eukprot:1159778-Pelagomonas_calceolata.AAC.6
MQHAGLPNARPHHTAMAWLCVLWQRAMQHRNLQVQRAGLLQFLLRLWQSDAPHALDTQGASSAVADSGMWQTGVQLASTAVADSGMWQTRVQLASTATAGAGVWQMEASNALWQQHPWGIDGADGKKEKKSLRRPQAWGIDGAVQAEPASGYAQGADPKPEEAKCHSRVPASTAPIKPKEKKCPRQPKRPHALIKGPLLQIASQLQAILKVVVIYSKQQRVQGSSRWILKAVQDPQCDQRSSGPWA